MKIHFQSPVSAQDLDQLLADNKEFVRFLSGRKILLTGGTGFFGKWLTQAFCQLKDQAGSQHRLVLWTRNKRAAIEGSPWLLRSGHEREEISWFEGDIRTPLPSSVDFDTVIHGATAASAALNEGNPREMYEVIVRGTENVISVARERQVRDFLFVSSGGIYGKQPESMTHIPETHAGGHPTILPGSAYGIGKTAAEFLSSCYARETGARVLIARCFAFVGPYLPLDTHFAVGNFVRDVLEKKDIQIGGDGTPFRSYMYGTDLVHWLMSILARGQSLQPYHVGSEDGRPLSEIAKCVSRLGREVTGFSAEVKIAKKPMPSAMAPSRFVPSTEITRKQLGVELRVDLDEALRRTFLWNVGTD